MLFSSPHNSVSLSVDLKTTSRRQVSLICFSNVVASFDFLIYIHMAPVLAQAFFPSSGSVWLDQLQVLSLFAVGFIARPIGGLIIGRYGDTQGRRPALRLSLAALTMTTLITAILPTYTQIGLFASFLFIIIRLCHGMAFGAHVPLSWVFISEHVNKQNMAAYCGLTMASLILGSIIALIFFHTLDDHLTSTEMVSYGWRIACAVGGILSLLTLSLWRIFSETPLFITFIKDPKIQKLEGISSTPKSESSFSKTPSHAPTLFHYLYKNPQTMTLIFALAFVQASLIIVIAILLPSLINLQFNIDPVFLASANLVGLLVMMIGSIFFGILADKNGLGAILMLGAVALVLQTLFFYYRLMTGAGEYILFIYALLGFFGGIVGVSIALFVQLFRPVLDCRPLLLFTM